MSNSGLAALEVAPGDEDRDRLFQLLEGARILAESGAGYEAARVLAGLAQQAGHQDPGREALQLLESGGLSIAAAALRSRWVQVPSK